MPKATKANVTKAMNAAGIPGTIWYDTSGRYWYGVDKLDTPAGDEFWTGERGTDLFPSLATLTTNEALEHVIYRAFQRSQNLSRLSRWERRSAPYQK